MEEFDVVLEQGLNARRSGFVRPDVNEEVVDVV
jgi:hypothetical protein